MKKGAILTIFLMLIALNLVSAINLNVSAKPIQNSVITDLLEPAKFELTIENAKVLSFEYTPATLEPVTPAFTSTF